MNRARLNDGGNLTHRGCLIYGILFFVGLPLLLGIIAVLLLIGRERSARQKLNARVESILAQGLPVDNASMTIYHKSLTSADHTQAWLDVLEELTGESFNASYEGVPLFDAKIEQTSWPIPGTPWAEESAVRRFLEQWEPLHQQIADLSRQQLRAGVSPVRFPVQFDFVNTLLPNTQYSRSAARLLMLRGQLAVYDGDSGATRESIEALLGNSQVLAGEPIVISQLVSLAIDGMALELLKAALEHDTLTEPDLQDLLARVRKQTEIGPGWRYALQGERAMMLSVFLDPSLAAGSLPVNQAFMPPGRSHDALHFLDHMEGVLDLPTRDLDNFMAGLEYEEAELQRIASGGVLARLDSLLTSRLTPATAAVGKAFVRQATMHRLAALAIGVRLFERVHGRPPNTLVELQEFGLDPIQLSPPGKKPFGYVTDSQTSTIWGFDSALQKSTPDRLPKIDPSEANADRKKMWIWTLPRLSPVQDN